MERSKVYEAIDSERAYQIQTSQDEDRPDILREDFNLSNGILAMEKILKDARDVWYKDHPGQSYQPTMDLLRKVTGIGVYLGEKYGMPERKSS